MSPSVTETLRSFYAENRQQLYTYAISITRQREAAEDVIQGAFQQLLRRDALPDELRPFVFRCLRNAAFDSLRRAKVRGDSMFMESSAKDWAAPTTPTPCLARDLDEMLQRLSPNEREAIVLKVFDEFTFQEIAELRGVPLPTVASWYRRGLEKLKTLIEKAP